MRSNREESTHLNWLCDVKDTRSQRKRHVTGGVSCKHFSLILVRTPSESDCYTLDLGRISIPNNPNMFQFLKIQVTVKIKRFKLVF